MQQDAWDPSTYMIISPTSHVQMTSDASRLANYVDMNAIPGVRSSLKHLSIKPILSQSRALLASKLFRAFLVIYIFSLITVRQLTRYDPSSVFFDARKGYNPTYSTIRKEQADVFVTKEQQRPHNLRFAHSSDFSLCVGIPTVARSDVRYFRSTVGSILEGLAPKERAEIYLMPFIADTDPMKHPAFSESWLHHLSDRVLFYNLSNSDGALDRIKKLESEKAYREKPLLDYIYVSEACIDTGAKYVAVLEDDVLALDGWFHRTKTALQQVPKLAKAKYGRNNALYLRLFYTEEFLGWNKERWPKYLGWSLLLLCVAALTVMAIRSYIPSTRTQLNNGFIIALCGICLPLTILLFFSSGTTFLRTIPNVSVREMNSYGCCSQGLVFSRSRAQEAVMWYKKRKIGYIDSLTEDFADEEGFSRWAVTPSVLQHVGKKSSKGDDIIDTSTGKMTVAETIWSFEFERNNAAALRKEHSEWLKHDRA